MVMEPHKGLYEAVFGCYMQAIAYSINELVVKSDSDAKVISSFVIGLLEPFDDETSNMKAFFHYNIQSDGELDIIKDFMTDSYTPPVTEDDIDLDDLISGLGISLN